MFLLDLLIVVNHAEVSLTGVHSGANENVDIKQKVKKWDMKKLVNKFSRLVFFRSYFDSNRIEKYLIFFLLLI